MTCQNDFTLPSELLEQIVSERFEVLPERIRIVINGTMQAERCSLYPLDPVSARKQ